MKRPVPLAQLAFLILFLIPYSVLGAEGRQTPGGEWRNDVRSRIEELNRKLKEYETGKRNHRDAYILLNDLYHKYGVLRQQDSAEARQVLKKKHELEEIHPELRQLQDFRLSEEIAEENRRQQAAETLRTEAERWSPSDAKPLKILGTERWALAIYQYKLRFFELPADVTLTQPPGGGARQLRRNGQAIAASDLRPKRELTFEHRFEVKPLHLPSPEQKFSNFLVCVQPLVDYVPVDEEERRMIQALKDRPSMRWINKRGRYEDFCGVVSVEGEVVFKLRYSQRSPDKLLRPLFMSADGKHAAVMVGEKVMDPGTGQPYVGNPREVWEWRFPDQVTKHAVTDPAIPIWELERQFRK